MNKTLFHYIALAAICVLVAIPASAQRQKVGVVLSGGGAKGVAHISVLKVIEEAGIPIDYIAGTSMGAIIGGLYAVGYDTHTLDSLVRTQNWTELLSDRVSRRYLSFSAKEVSERYLITLPLTNQKKFRLPSGLVGGNNVYNLLTELTIGYHDSIPFNTLPVPFACVAYDMVTGEAVTLDDGYLARAIRASMSIPGAFEPVHMDGMVLIDGGISNNFPADVVKAMGADIIIGVDVTAGARTEDELKTLSDMFNQITYFTGVEAYKKNRPLVDVYIKPDITGYGAGSFSAEAIDTLLVRGEKAAYESFGDLMALRPRIGLEPGYMPEGREPVELDQPLPLANIRFEGLQYQKEKTLGRIAGLRDSTLVRPSEIQVAVEKLQGTENLSEVNYRLEGNAPYDLVFMVKESTRNSISLGLRVDTEEMAAILLNVNLAANQMSNSHFDVTARLSENPYIRGSYILGNEAERKMTLYYMYKYNSIGYYNQGKKVSNLDFNQHTVDLSFANIRLRNFKVGAGVMYEYIDLKGVFTNWGGSDLVGERPRSDGMFMYHASTQVETLDRRYNPKSGLSFTADYTFYTSNFVNYHGNTPFSALHADFYAALSMNRRITFIPGVFTRVIMGRNAAFTALNMLGGTVPGRYFRQQIPFIGVHRFEVFDNAVMGARLDVRGRIGKKYFISMKANYMKEEHSFFDILKGRDIWGVGLAGSVNTIMGPIDLLVDYSNRTKKVGVYANLGYYF
ncbi:MAG: patatin-like phospholipase family protein [Alistipes sp.]|nr:patatin-like phospholipase family protein [Alistipes sp.]